MLKSPCQDSQGDCGYYGNILPSLLLIFCSPLTNLFMVVSHILILMLNGLLPLFMGTFNIISRKIYENKLVLLMMDQTIAGFSLEISMKFHPLKKDFLGIKVIPLD